MRFKFFDWDEINTTHIAQHSVTSEEAEEACFCSPLILKSRLGRYYVLGRTFAGRYLTVIVQPKSQETVRIITARPMSEAEHRRYMRR